MGYLRNRRHLFTSAVMAPLTEDGVLVEPACTSTGTQVDSTTMCLVSVPYAAAMSVGPTNARTVTGDATARPS